MTRRTGPTVAILGAGPLGVEAALAVADLGWPFTVYEAGQVGESVGRWAFAKMLTPFGWNTTPLGLQTLQRFLPGKELPPPTAFQTGREFREGYLLPIAQSPMLNPHIKLQHSVLSISRTGTRKLHDDRNAPFRLLVRGPNNVELLATADVILDCTGTYTRPNWLGDGGIPALGELASRQFIPYWLDDICGAKKANYLGRSIIVIGSGLSAATAITDLSKIAVENASTWTTWLTNTRRRLPILRLQNDPLRERDRLATAANTLAGRGEGNIDHHGDVRIDEVQCAGMDKGYRVVGRISGKSQTWEAERLLAHVGYKPDATMTAELNIAEPTGEAITAEQNYFILGSKSAGRSRMFLLRDGHEQLRQIFERLTKRATA